MRALAILFSAGAIAVAAGNGARANSPVLTASAFQSQAGAICKRLGNLGVPPAGTPAAAYLSGAAKVRTATLSLAQLKAPRALVQLDRQVVALQAGDVAYLQSVASRLKSGAISADGARRAFLARARSSAVEARLWKKLGVPACA